MKSIGLLSILFLLISCSNNTEKVIKQEIIDFEGYKTALLKQDDVLYVVNFWATWCVPCVEELPHFIETNEKYKNEDFNMTFVSLDRAKQFESRVIPFAEKYQMNADLLLLDDVKNMNTWIKDIDTDWSGAIPATVFYKNGKKLHFTEGQLTKEELENLIQKHL